MTAISTLLLGPGRHIKDFTLVRDKQQVPLHHAAKRMLLAGAIQEVDVVPHHSFLPGRTARSLTGIRIILLLL